MLFEAGLGNGLESWDLVVDVATFTVVAYRRAGYGGGSYQADLDGKRTAGEVARQLNPMTSSGKRFA